MKIHRLNPDLQTPAGEGWALNRTHPLLRVGRAPDSTLFLDDPSVSLEHATLTWQNGTVLIRDLDSINGITFKNRRIQRAEFLETSTLFIGSVPIRIETEKSDKEARVRAFFWRIAVVLGALAAVLVILVAWKDIRRVEEAEAPAPVEPPIPFVLDDQTRAHYDNLQKASRLAEEGSILLGGEKDAEAAAVLVQSIRLVDEPDTHAQVLLAGLQAKYLPAAERQIQEAVAREDFAAAQQALDKVSVYFVEETPPQLEPLRNIIRQNMDYQEALDLLDEEDLDGAETLLAKVDARIIPGAVEAQAKIQHIREARAWVDGIADAVDDGQLDEAKQMLSREAEFAADLTDSIADDLLAAKARLYAYQQLLAFVEKQDVYSLAAADFTVEVPAIAGPVAAFRNQLGGQAEAFRAQAAAAEANAGDGRQPAQTDAEAFASRAAAQAYAGLYLIAPSDETRAPYLRHRDRWNAYLASVISRANGYAAYGANEEIRSMLEPLLPRLDPEDPAAKSLFQLAHQLGMEAPR